MLKIAESKIAPADAIALTQIKTWISRVIEQRDTEGWSSSANPSEVWRFVTQIFNYVLSLPAEQFGNLRLHTYHIDGSTYLKVLFLKDNELKRHYDHLCAGLPERYKLSAPDACGEYGRTFDGGYFVNDKVLVWQELIKALWSAGKLQHLDEQDGQLILEIGGGYGSLTHQLYSLYPKAKFIIVDLPETLLFSASYLALIHGDKHILLVEDDRKLSMEAIEEYSFILVPNHLLASLADLKLELSINVESFQEMTSTQVREYLEFLQPRTKALLSWNYERSTFNDQLESVTKILNDYFVLSDLPYYVLESPINKIRRRTIGRSMLAVGIYNFLVGILRSFRGSTGPKTLGWQPLKRYWAIPKDSAGQVNGHAE